MRTTCPSCRTRLHFEQLYGMRLYREVDSVYVYRAKCPSCGPMELTTKRRPS
jgi:hypothetical protein